MNPTAWNVVPVLALLALGAAPVAARATPAPQSVAEKTKDGAEKVKDAVVKGVTVATDKTKEGVAVAADKTKEGVTVAADKTKEGLSKSGEVITDEWITTRVHARFVDEDLLKGSDISVDTSKHVVTLKGTVTGRAGRARATTVAKNTEGVNRVVNLLTIGPRRKV